MSHLLPSTVTCLDNLHSNMFRQFTACNVVMHGLEFYFVSCRKWTKDGTFQNCTGLVFALHSLFPAIVYLKHG